MRLYLLQYGLENDGTPFPGYLIRADDGTNILVDTGFPASAVGTHPFPNLLVKPEDHVLHQLGLAGLKAADIHTLVCTHFDYDHSGAHDLFTAAECVVQRRHWNLVHSEAMERFDRYRASWNHPVLRYRMVDGDSALVPGVELLDTSGHVTGHQSVLVRLAGVGPVLLAIDAAPRLTQFDSATYEPNPSDMDPAAAQASIQKMKDVIAREGVKLTVCGHDSKQWATLRKAPEYYE
ncbi:MAG: N-acyl homoserine lactonase family protein [Chloroflexi bacterium]|nr:N-acyl homoserine lactonase family protein [Chloroflexota bacterium]